MIVYRLLMDCYLHKMCDALFYVTDLCFWWLNYMYCFCIVCYFYIMFIFYEILTCSVSLFSSDLSNCAPVTVMNVSSIIRIMTVIRACTLNFINCISLSSTSKLLEDYHPLKLPATALMFNSMITSSSNFLIFLKNYCSLMSPYHSVLEIFSQFHQ
jgi:hypothetical protein